MQMPSNVADRDIPRFIRIVLITAAGLIGSGYAFGPPSWYSSGSFAVLRSIEWFPIPMWGACFIVAAVLMSFTKLVGYAFATILWSTWGLGLAVTIVEGSLSGWGAVVWPFFGASVAGYEVHRWGEKRAVAVRQKQLEKQRQVDAAKRHRDQNG